MLVIWESGTNRYKSDFSQCLEREQTSPNAIHLSLVSPLDPLKKLDICLDKSLIACDQAIKLIQPSASIFAYYMNLVFLQESVPVAK